MKALILLFITLVCLSSCDNNKHYDCIYTIIDQSDSFAEVSHLTSSKLQSFLSLSKEPLHGATFWLAQATNYIYNPTQCVSVAETDRWSVNEFERKDTITAFYKQMDTLVESMKKQNKDGTDGSHVFFAMAQGVKALIECSECTNRTLIMTGDLKENSTLLNCYDEVQLKNIHTNPSRYMQLLDSSLMLPSLHGVKVCIIHEPLTEKDDADFHLLSQFVKSYLQKHGATVIVSSTFQY
jgi:hypothetical protein